MRKQKEERSNMSCEIEKFGIFLNNNEEREREASVLLVSQFVAAASALEPLNFHGR
jgi:hypothetical protein